MATEEPPPAYQETNASAPPAYDENQEEADGNATATAAKQSKPPKEKRADEPAPDGEGVLASPLRRMMGLGVILLLYYILSFWMPVYWMAGAANFCKFRCNTWNDSAGGCYQSTNPDCEDQCDALCEQCSESDSCKAVVDSAYESSYANSGIDARLGAFTMTVLGFLSGAAGVVLGYFAVKKGKTLFSQIAAVLLGLGSVMIIIGGLIFMCTWHESIDFEEYFAAMQIMVWLEWLLPSVIGIILAIDIFTFATIFNDSKKRMLAMSVPFAVVGFMGGILWAYVINFDYVGTDFGLYDQGGCIAAGYFLMSFMSIGRILVFGEFVEVPMEQKVMIKFVLSILLFVGAFICAVGYWAMIDGIFDCDYSILSGSYTCENLMYAVLINGDSMGLYYALVGGTDVHYEGQFKCYYVSYTFFILLATALNVYDMDIVENYKTVRAAQQAASAASAATASPGAET